ncbi:ArsR/SmtB family transcription factor [Streptomyces galbus]|uniref:Winged helix-turn-helix transcriptional regulator n=1 Tax=Streptomyces galbus TaxID=33898 RepID=A0ABX1ILE9_STRGB|nr:winged helix-turn-helix transcriptional regulator [Streptomyces galbus]NKQ26085.1 winged helix-turn-helix transcriptional regulator [Streptomyces galbus]
MVQHLVAEPTPPEPALPETLTLRFDALAHPVRLRLLRTSACGPHTTGELAHGWEPSPQGDSRHLAVLRPCGASQARRQGRYVRYSHSLPA